MAAGLFGCTVGSENYKNWDIKQTEGADDSTAVDGPNWLRSHLAVKALFAPVRALPLSCTRFATTDSKRAELLFAIRY